MPRYRVGPLHVVSEQRVLYREDQLVTLAPRAFDILLVLVEHAGEVVSREELHERVWGESFVEDTNLSKNVSILRSILRDHLAETEAIRTLSKRGYQLVLKVVVEEAAPLPVTVTRETPIAASPVTLQQASAAEAGKAAYANVAERRAEDRRWWFAGLAALVLLALAGWWGLRQMKVHRVLAGDRPSLAVLRLRNLSQEADKDWLGVALEESVGADLARDDGARLVGGDRTAQAERDLQLTSGGAVDAAKVQTLGRVLEVRQIVTGSYLPIAHEVRLDLELRDAATGKILTQYSDTTSEDNLLKTVSAASTQLREAMQLPPQKSAGKLTSLALAEQQYAEGLRLSRSGRAPVEAREMLSKAVAADPHQPQFHAALASSWAALGFDAEAGREARLAIEDDGALVGEPRLSLEAAAYQIMGERDRAGSLLKQLIQQFPDEPDYVFRLATLEALQGKLADADTLLSKLREPGSALAADPRVPLLQARIAGQRGDAKGELLQAGEAEKFALAHDQRSLVAYALLYQGNAWNLVGDFDRSMSDLQRSQRLYAEMGDDGGVANALASEGNTLERRHDPAADATLERAVALAQKIGYQRVAGNITLALGNALLAAHHPAEAEATYLRVAAIARTIGAIDLEMRATGNLVLPAMARDDLPRALLYAQQSFALAKATGMTEGLAHTTNTMADIEIAQGKLPEAEAHLRQSIDYQRPLGDPGKLDTVLYDLADLQRVRGDLAGSKATYASIDRGALTPLYKTYVPVGEAHLAVDQGHPETVVAPMTALAASAPDAAHLALSVVSEADLLLGRTADAHAAAQKALALCAGPPADRACQLDNQILLLQAALAQGETASVAHALPALLKDAYALDNAEAVERVRLLQGEVQQRQGGGSQLLRQVAAEAGRQGFGLIARRATAEVR